MLKLCEKFRIGATGSLSELGARFVAFFKTDSRGAGNFGDSCRGNEAVASSVDIQTGDDPVGKPGAPVWSPGYPGMMGVGLPPSSIRGSDMHVLLELVKSLDVVDEKSPKV